MIKNKTRQLPLSEYYSVLQKEYLVAELRYKIYLSPKDKSYYKDREMEGKRKIIEDLSLRNNLASIFTSEERLDFYKKTIYNEVGLPNFVYRNSEDRTNRRPKDILFYFYKGTEVEIITDSNTLIGVVNYVHIERNYCDVIVQGETFEFPFTRLKRIFKED